MRRTRLIPMLLATALAAALLPAGAAAANLVPQGNSAVSQYTEGFPTGGGEKGSTAAGDSGATPGQAIGAKNAKKLAEHGSEGRAAAEVAAATAPPTTDAGGGSSSGSTGKGSDANAKHDKHETGGGKKGTSRGGDTTVGARGESGGGASALGSLTGAATGADDGNLGLLLPLLLLAVLVWGGAYAIGQRKRSAAP